MATIRSVRAGGRSAAPICPPRSRPSSTAMQAEMAEVRRQLLAAPAAGRGRQPRHGHLRAGRHPPHRRAARARRGACWPSTPWRRGRRPRGPPGRGRADAARGARPAPSWPSCRCDASATEPPSRLALVLDRGSASQRPMPAGARPRRSPAVPTSIGAGPVEQGRAVERVRPCRRPSIVPSPRGSSKATTVPVHQWTILASGSSMMSLAPASLRAGIRVLIVSLATTVSTA